MRNTASRFADGAVCASRLHSLVSTEQRLPGDVSAVIPPTQVSRHRHRLKNPTTFRQDPSTHAFKSARTDPKTQQSCAITWLVLVLEAWARVFAIVQRQAHEYVLLGSFTFLTTASGEDVIEILRLERVDVGPRFTAQTLTYCAALALILVFVDHLLVPPAAWNLESGAFLQHGSES